jgi:hypothetical protein
MGKILPMDNFSNQVMLEMAANCFDSKKNGENPINEVIEILKPIWKVEERVNFSLFAKVTMVLVNIVKVTAFCGLLTTYNL